ncbi:HNH endonuclease [Aeromicrobium piscarium]|nr:HNH endonuclease signature motif containing protein [Aeromicrobium piscarium]
MSSGDLAQRLRDTAALLDAFAPSTDALRALEETSNAIDAAQAQLTAEMSETLEHEGEGYSSVKAWLRDQLRVSSRRANELVRSGVTLKQIPEAVELASAGGMSLEHVKHLSYAVTHVGPGHTRDLLPELLDVAASAEPAALRQVVRTLRDAVYPDELDQAWIDGMAREDIQVNPVPDGWHVYGFLNSTTGAKLTTLLQSLSAPQGADDPRTSAQRRVDGLERLLDSVLENGLPGDKGVRPHLALTIDASTLMDDAGAGELVGFGTIGIRQLQEMICEADITPVAVGGKDGVLDVGRSSRLATPRQRTAVLARQGHECASPGCRAPVVHIHHIIWWSRGGPTDLANLIGLCPRCHRAVHAGALVIDPTTHEFTDRHGRLLPGADPRHHKRRLPTHPPATRLPRAS